MSDFHFRPAVRENVGLIIMLMGPSGCGKTYSALRLASGIARASGKKRFRAIGTENRRMLHYADFFDFDYCELKAPFRPDKYKNAITAAGEGDVPAIVVDSMSHEWAGDGGVLDWQEELFAKAGHRESHRLSSWIKPKGSHKKMATELLRVLPHLILCFRAEPKVEMVKNSKTGKTEVVAKDSPIGWQGWIPICEKSLPYEGTVSFMLTAEKPGVPHPIKLQEQHKEIFPTGKQLDEDAGERLAKWAAGGKVERVRSQPTAAPKAEDPEGTPADGENLLSDDVGEWVGQFTGISKDKEGPRVWFTAPGVKFYSLNKDLVEYVKDAGGRSAKFKVEYEREEGGDKITMITAVP